MSENYESLAHETDQAEPEEDTDSVKLSKISVFKLESKKFDKKLMFLTHVNGVTERYPGPGCAWTELSTRTRLVRPLTSARDCTWIQRVSETDELSIVKRFLKVPNFYILQC